MMRFLILFVFFLASINSLQAQNVKDRLRYPEMVSAFYSGINKRNFWTGDTSSARLRQEFLQVLDSADNWALSALDYHYTELQKLAEVCREETDSNAVNRCEQLFTDAAISFFKDIYKGNDNKAGYDEISLKYSETSDRMILNNLVAVGGRKNILEVVNSLEPTNPEYSIFKCAYQQAASIHSDYKKLQLKRTLNYMRWINHFRFPNYIVVNIPAAELRYYRYDTIALRMKAIVGKPSTPTPRFSAYCNKVILYPYWNVPASIAKKELLPLFKKDPSQVDAMNMQIVNSRGNVVSASSLNWSSFSRYYFPYNLRQSTGCDNALGVMKFNLTDPFNVYMHDTNNKSTFNSPKRFYSHGCIRIEKPLELANYILPKPVDSSFLQACLKNQKPIELNLVQVVPVFVIYSTAGIDANGRVIYYDDIYGLLKR